MKKLFFAAAAVLAFGAVSAQETKFGVKAGVDFATVEVKGTFMGVDYTAKGSETGFFVGGFVEIGVSDSFAIQPEVNYVAISDSNMLTVPVLGKFKFAEKFAAYVGPSMNYMLDAEEDEFKVNVDAGLGYQFTDNIDASARYSMGFGDVKVSGVFVGVGYKF